MAQNDRCASLVQPVVPPPSSDGDSDWSFLTPSIQASPRLSNGFSDLNSNISLPEDWETHPLLQSTQDTTQPEVSQTPVFQDSNLDNLQYDDGAPLDVSDSVEYDWQVSGHCFIGERVSVIYPNGLTARGTVRQYLPPDGDDSALFRIVHDDGDSEDLDGYECFAAMEQYRKNFSPLNLNSAFARHFESKVVTINRLMKFSRAVLLQLSLYLDMEVVGRINSEGFVKKYFKIHGV